jgi:outer membrane protein TolC
MEDPREHRHPASAEEVTTPFTETIMFGRDESSTPHAFCTRALHALTVLILLAAVAAAQEAPRSYVPLILQIQDSALPDDARVITLPDAQQQAQVAAGPLMRLGELQVEAARQHRLGVKSLYFPSISAQADYLHLTEVPGQIFSVQRPLSGALISLPVQAVFQDQNAVNVVVTQPITQLFGVRQLVKIARADENIARAKAGMPITEVARQVEKNFFELLIAQHELAAAAADAKKVRTSLVAETFKTLAAGKVATLTASLNDLLGLPLGTRLELVPPAPLVESLTLKNALATAQSSPSLEVIEAEQTAVKAHSAERLAKLEYGPGIAIMGGYLHQHALSTTILPEDFAYVGVVGTYTLFDSFKRQHSVKEASAQAKAAAIGVQLARDKAAAAVKAAYFELERSRDAYFLARQMLPPTHPGVRLVSDDRESESNRARAEADVFRAEMAYRAAYATVTSLMAQ